MVLFCQVALMLIGATFAEHYRAAVLFARLAALDHLAPFFFAL